MATVTTVTAHRCLDAGFVCWAEITDAQENYFVCPDTVLSTSLDGIDSTRCVVCVVFVFV